MLSDKIIRKYPHVDYVREMVLTKDVKQFIKDLKEELLIAVTENLYSYVGATHIPHIIDKLAGDKLNGA